MKVTAAAPSPSTTNKSFTNATPSISPELFQQIQSTLLLFFKEIQDLGKQVTKRNHSH